MLSPRTTIIPVMLLILVSIAGMFVFVPASKALEIDSIAIPHWERNQTAPNVYLGSLDEQARDAQSSVEAFCPEIFQVILKRDVAAMYFDSAAGVSQIYASWYPCIRFDIYSDLSYDSTDLALDYGLPWVAADLDLDGNIELILQRGDGSSGFLDIHSAPAWDQRSRATFPGLNVYFSAVAVNVDADPYLEVFATPSSLGGTLRAVMVQYDEIADTFVVTDYLPAPTGSGGRPAYGDFDEDGRIEFIVGTDDGYVLFEHDGESLSYIGPVGTPLHGNNFDAIAASPFSNDSLYALTGHSGVDGYVYELLQATGDNTFAPVHSFNEVTGWAGNHACLAADTDCDGRDELFLEFFPLFEVFDLDAVSGSFVEECTWDFNVTRSSFLVFHAVDLNQDGVDEWGTIDQNYIFQVYSEDFCAEPRTGLVSWWPLDEVSGVVTTDVWGKNDGTWLGDPLPAAGYVAGCLLLDGAEDYVQVADIDSLDFGTSDLSVEAWVNTTSTSSVNPLLSKYDNANDLGWALWVADGNTLGFNLADGLASDYASAAAPGIADGGWHHLAVTIDRDDVDGIKFYLDSGPIGTTDPTDRPSSVSNDVALMLGAWSSTPGDTAFFDGMLDEVSVYNHALDSAEIRCIFLADSRGKCQPDTSCNCPSQGDLEPDGFLTAIDLAGTIDALFAGGENPQDTWCPTFRFDIDCDEFTTALDLSILIDHLFAGGNGPCDPCGP